MCEGGTLGSISSAGPSMRQPIHTVYGGAHLFRHDTASRLGATALRALDDYAPDPSTFAELFGLRETAAHAIYARVRRKLQEEPVEDFRLDFEDGYGTRTDTEEDGHAESAAAEVAAGLKQQLLPPFIGIRVKSLSGELRARALRTASLFTTSLLEGTDGVLPPNFVVTLPKITSVEQIERFVEALVDLEGRAGLPDGALRMELMVETPQSIFDRDGLVALPAFVRAAGGRVTGAHFGTYDYTASLGITAAFQHMRHPACDFARQVMQVALAGTDVWLSDGATNVLPVPIHRAEAGTTLTEAYQAANRTAVHRAWKLHYDDIRHSLQTGFYQGWDLHPAQLVTRYAAVYGFFLESLDAASERLRNFIAKAAQATLIGEVFDDAATGQGLLNFFIRALNCRAIHEHEVERLTGLTLEELHSASFVRIVRGRTAR